MFGISSWDKTYTYIHIVSLSSCKSHSYSIVNFQHSAEYDECTNDAHNCSENATCTDTLESYNCTCKTGYRGDGHTCLGKPSIS